MIKLARKILLPFCVIVTTLANVQAKECLVFLPAGRNLNFWDDMEAEVKLEAKRQGLVVYTKGTNSELQFDQQVKLYQDLKKFNCKGLIIAPNSLELQTLIEKDNFYKYVYLVDRSMAEKTKFSLIATDNYEAGVSAARLLAKKLLGKGKIILFKLKENISTTSQRELGFEDEIKKTNIEIIHQEYMGLDQGEARSNVLKILKKYAGKFDGAFTSNELLSNALVTNLKLLKSHGQDTFKNSHFIVFDTNPTIENALFEGFIDAIVAQNSKKMGREAVKLIKKSYEKNTYYKYTIDTGTYIIKQ